MTEAEGSASNGSGESSVATPQDGVTSDGDKKTQLTGIYDLVAVLTRKGRSADSGHCVAWFKQESDRFSGFNWKCIEYVDYNPIPQREEDITKLSRGGKLSIG